MPLRLVIFDFDLTLSTIHLFHALAGTARVPLQAPPYAKTEWGQLARLLELDDSPQYQGQGGFSVAVLGGLERVATLQALLADLRAAGVEAIVCTRGFIGPVRKCLEFAGLLHFFSQVYGNIGDLNGTTDYDVSIPISILGADAHHLGAVERSMEEAGRSKQKVVSRCLQERGLGPTDAVFVDDTWEEISNMQGTCLTIQVQPPHGIGQREITLLRGLLAGGASAEAVVAAVLGSLEVPPAPSPAGRSVPGRASSAPPAATPMQVPLSVRTPPGSLCVEMPAASGSQVDPYPLLGGSLHMGGPQHNPPPRGQCGQQTSQHSFLPMPGSLTATVGAPASVRAPVADPNRRRSVSPAPYAQGAGGMPRLPDLAEGPPSILPPEILRVGEEQKQQREEAEQRRREAQRETQSREEEILQSRSEQGRESRRESGMKVCGGGARLPSFKICGPEQSFLIMDSRDHVPSSCSLFSSDGADDPDQHWFRVDDDWQDWIAPNVIKQRGFGPAPGTPLARRKGKQLDGNQPGCCNQ
mmetsp:Transcript_40949/g.67812  ORF Transcript_40949/g.67812 Transcript_40949/m.67812 type:complete len:527 (-) Transcript_40949:44-1624(-)